jgi:hypothetical protein
MSRNGEGRNRERGLNRWDKCRLRDFKFYKFAEVLTTCQHQRVQICRPAVNNATKVYSLSSCQMLGLIHVEH